MRQSLKQILSVASEVSVIAEAGSPDEVFQRLAEGYIPDLILATSTVLPVLSRLSSQYPQVKVLIQSVHRRHVAIAALRVGAWSYIQNEVRFPLKLQIERENEYLIAGIRAIMQGKKYISENLAKGFDSPSLLALLHSDTLSSSSSMISDQPSYSSA